MLFDDAEKGNMNVEGQREGNEERRRQQDDNGGGSERIRETRNLITKGTRIIVHCQNFRLTLNA